MTVIADKACDTTATLDHLAEVGATAATPSRSNSTEARMHDNEVNAMRNPVGRFFGRSREFRRAATRYGKRVRDFLPAAILAATRHPMRGLARATV